MITQAIYTALLLSNLVLIVASFWIGSKILRFCQIALFLTAIGLALMMVALVGLLLPDQPPEGRWAGVKILLVAISPILAELLLLMVIYRRRTKRG